MISTTTMLWPTNAILKKRIAMVALDTLICLGLIPQISPLQNAIFISAFALPKSLGSHLSDHTIFLHHDPSCFSRPVETQGRSSGYMTDHRAFKSHVEVFPEENALANMRLTMYALRDEGSRIGMQEALPGDLKPETLPKQD